MKKTNSEAEALIAKALGEIERFDAAGREIDDIQARRRVALSDDAQDHHQLDALNKSLRGCEQAREDASSNLAKCLPALKAAVRESAESKPSQGCDALLILLDDESESALVRCEQAADFLGGAELNV